MNERATHVTAWLTTLVHVLGSVLLGVALMAGVGGGIVSLVQVLAGGPLSFWLPLGISCFLLGMCLIVICHFGVITVYNAPHSSRRPLPGLTRLNSD